MSDTEHIGGAEKLIAALGDWPSFHDAEIVSISAQRHLPVALGASTVELVVHVRRYESRGQGTARYEQVVVKSILARFLCKQVADLELSQFNHQNVINALSVQAQPSAEAPGAPLVLTIEPIWGLGGTVRCATVELSSVQELPSAGA
jgi:hypothetical protein